MQFKVVNWTTKSIYSASALWLVYLPTANSLQQHFCDSVVRGASFMQHFVPEGFSFSQFPPSPPYCCCFFSNDTYFTVTGACFSFHRWSWLGWVVVLAIGAQAHSQDMGRCDQKLISGWNVQLAFNAREYSLLPYLETLVTDIHFKQMVAARSPCRCYKARVLHFKVKNTPLKDKK